MNQFPTNQFPTNLFPPWKDLESLSGHCSHQGAEDAFVYRFFFLEDEWGYFLIPLGSLDNGCWG